MIAIIIEITLTLCNIFNLIFLNDLLSAIPNGEYSFFFFFSSTLGLCPKSSPVKYSYFSKRSLEDKADVLTASQLKSY